MQRIKHSLVLFLLALGAYQTGYAQMTVLRKNLKNQEERNTTYSQRTKFFTNVYQIGNLVRNTSHDSLTTAKGMSSWIYGIGTGAVLPLAGPVWLNLEAAYQYRNYRMRSDEKSILAQVERLQKHKVAVHTLSLSGYLRLSSSKNGIIQGKYLEIGYNFGLNFGNRLILFQGVDRAQSLGASQVKNKYKNTDMIAPTAQHLCVRVGREGLALFAEYRITDFFRRSPYVYNNQKLPELSKLSLGLTLILNDKPGYSNTDETEPAED